MIELKSRITLGEQRVDTKGGQSGLPIWIHEEEGAPPEVFEQIEAWVKVDDTADLPS